jgi:YHS domain-containing protein
VAGLGSEFQPDCCPGTPFTYHYKIYCVRQVTPQSPSVDYKGGKLYFCCVHCVPIFKKSPAKFAASANLQLFASRQAKQVRCPLCGGAPCHEVSLGGVNVDIGSAACLKKFEQAKPAERLEMLFGDAAFARGFVMKVPPAAAAPKSATPAPGAPGAAAPGCCCQPPDAP